MLLAILLHLLIFHLLTASDAPPPRKDSHKDSEYKIKHIDTCPDVGFFFNRETTANSLDPGTCYLCFCQADHNAVCWKRDNRKCSTESFHYHGIGKREKRSPGFSDIFFRDASRDIFNKNSKTQCKPYESSFSDDCPPADWCTGCTVCDCDANGRWDCHLLSFCPDDQKKKHRGIKPQVWKPFKEKTQEKVHNLSSKSKPVKGRNVVKDYKVAKKSNKKSTPKMERGGNKKPQTKRIVRKKIPKKAGMTPNSGKINTPVQYKKVAPNKANATKKKIIKKNVATRKPIQIKTTKVSTEKELAHKLMQQVIQSMRKSVSAKVKNMSAIAKKNADNVKNMKAKAKLSQDKLNKQKHKRQVKKPKPPMRKKKQPVKKPVYRAKAKPTKKPCGGQHMRSKRDVTEVGNIGIPTAVTLENSAVSTNTTEALTVLPAISNARVSYDDKISNALLRNTSFPDNKYYKYSVGNEIAKFDLPIDTATTHFNKTETVINFLGANVNSTTEKRHIQNNEVNKDSNLTETNLKDNRIKFSKWNNIKISKEKKIISDSDIKLKRLMKLMSHTNKTITFEDNNRSHGKKVERILNYRKYNLVKLLNHSKCKYDNCNNNNTVNINMPTRNIYNVSRFYEILWNRYKNNTKVPPKRRRKSGVLKYLKGILNRIFKTKKKSDRMNKHQLIETLCANFGPCRKVNRKQKIILNSKLTDLDRETTNILKTVKIIKGLLKLLDLPKSINSNFSKQDHFRNEIQRLNDILKDSYSKKSQVALTETQITQIEYIKRSIKDFIKSVSKFASLLNDIITILTKQDTNRFKSMVKNYLINKNLTKDDPFQSLRNLLVRYKLVQNTFMNQMYEQLNQFENKINEKPKVSPIPDLNNSIAIENISRNIINNLRKLKRMAQTVSSSRRSKRETARDDDAIEYLLMLMEYLIKQNHPLDAEPVNDGIDLLIEAIKNAPDIKSIKKKVLENTPVIYLTTTSTSPKTPSPFSKYAAEDTHSEDDSPSESDKISSSEDSGKARQENVENKLNENKYFVEVVADDEKEFEDKLQFDRRAESDKTDITEMSFFGKLEGEDNIMPVLETTTFSSTMPLEMEMGDKLDSRDDLNAEKTLTIETNNLDKPVDYSEAGDKKIEVFTDIDEETVYPTTTVQMSDSDMTTIEPTEYSTQRFEAQKSVTKLTYDNLETYDNDSNDKRSKLKWIEENFGQESEKRFTGFDDANSTLGITPVTAKTISARTIDKIDVSGITKEKGGKRESTGEREKVSGGKSASERQRAAVKERADERQNDDETEKKKSSVKLSADEVMFRKQMELLNSLDYGTERAELYESDGKDSNNEDRYSGDSFPAYFV